MQIALHDIRRLGYTKICKEFDILDINTKLRNLYFDLGVYDSSAFKVLNNWNEMQPFLVERYVGFVDLVNNYTPLIENIGVDIVAKRKFRNTWNKIWKNISTDLNLGTDTTDLLSECGIKLALFLSNDIDIDDNLRDIINFYNLLLKWSIFTEKELNFIKNNLTHVQVLELMTLKTDREFVDFIQNNIF